MSYLQLATPVTGFSVFSSHPGAVHTPDPAPSLLSLRVFISQWGTSGGTALAGGSASGLCGALRRQGPRGRKCGSVGWIHVDSTVGGKAGLGIVPLSPNNVHSISMLLTLLDFFLCHLVQNDVVRINLRSANHFWTAVSDSSFLPARHVSVAIPLPGWSSN